jgi:hypothetical protein
MNEWLIFVINKSNLPIFTFGVLLIVLQNFSTNIFQIEFVLDMNFKHLCMFNEIPVKAMFIAFHITYMFWNRLFPFTIVG